MYRLIILLVFLSIGVFGSLNSVQLKAEYKDWLFYTGLEDGERICYIVSYPKEMNEYCLFNQNKSYVMVSYVDKKAGEVSVTSCFQYDDKEPVVLHIDKKVRYSLPVVSNGVAWTEDIRTDQELILRMNQGISMIAVRKKGALTSIDTYSLLGFRNAYQKMQDLCRA